MRSLHLVELVVVLVLAVGIDCRILLNTWGLYSSAYFHCVLGKGYDKIVLKLDSRQTAINPDDIRNINAARNSGLLVQPALTPCSLKTPQSQAERISKSFLPNTISKIWAVPWQTSNSCAWRPYYPKQNCDYLQKFIKAMQGYNITVGIFSNREFWSQLFGGIGGCGQVADVDFWWEPLEEEDDGLMNFNSYHQIGGWKLPTMKQTTTVDVCGAPCDKNYYI